MKRILVICLAAMMLLASLAGCRSGNTNTSPSPSPIVSASPSASPHVPSSPNGNVNDTDGIIDDAGDALQDTGHAVEDTVDDLVHPSESVSPDANARSRTTR